jgi:molecular chaperone GrpE
VTQFGDENDEINDISDTGNGLDTNELESSEGDSLKAQNDELRREKLYLLADFDNFRKQAIKERSEIVKYGNEPIIREFLGIYDNLERAAETEVTPETLSKYKEGITLIASQFQKLLERFGVEEVESHGQPFDPSLHEALSSENNPDFPANSVSQVLKKAYKLKGKVIRPAQVVVNTGANTSKES